MRSRTFLLAAVLAVTSAAAAHAQYYEDERYDRSGGALGFNLMFADPQGEFGDFVDDGWGGGLHYIRRIGGDRSVVGLRLDANLINYGHERFRVPLSGTIGGRITVDVTTDNNIGFLGIGPQVGLPTGRIQPYVNGFVGVSYIFTSTQVSGDNSEVFASDTNFDDASFAYGGGAGLYIPISRGRTPISLDAGLTYRRAGEAEYLREGDIVDNPDGTITLFPVESETSLLTVQIGVSIGTR